MRHIVLGLMLLIVGFLSGVGYSMAALTDPAASVSGSDPVLVALRRSTARIEANLEQGFAALRRDGRPRDRRTADTPSIPTVEPRVIRAPDQERLAALASWNGDGALRRKWLFAPNDEVLAWFGAPDEIAADGGSQWWSYSKVDSGRTTGAYKFRLSGDRVIDFACVGADAGR